MPKACVSASYSNNFSTHTNGREGAAHHDAVSRHADHGIDPAPVLHRFVSVANEPDYLALGWMRERPRKPPVQNFGVWLMWPCTTCSPRRAALGRGMRRPMATGADPLTTAEEDDVPEAERDARGGPR
jgi:hypothetical protein